MDLINKLKKYKKKTITKSELAELFSAYSDEALYKFVDQLSSCDVLVPITTSKTNGNKRFPIYLKYKINIAMKSYDNELKQISSLHPKLQKDDYLIKNPQEFDKYRIYIEKLDCFLFANPKQLLPISRKERSFEIFDEEKVLDNKSFCTFLEKIGLDRNNLYYYDTPEYCFNDFCPQIKSEMVLLICENKDIWFNIRRMMFEDDCFVLFDTQIDGVVYGCGNKISQNNALTTYTSFMGKTKVRYLYWGDIDRAGFNIYLSLIKSNPKMDIQLFLPAYEEMIRLAKIKKIPQSKDKREIMGDYSAIFSSIHSSLQVEIQESISQNRRIPQEIITYSYLKKTMR